MSSDSESDVFLTQNSFTNQNANDNDDDEFNFNEIFPSLHQGSEKFYPVVSDISDDDMLAATLAAEDEGPVPVRFEKPVDDNEMADISRRR